MALKRTTVRGRKAGLAPAPASAAGGEDETSVEIRAKARPKKKAATVKPPVTDPEAGVTIAEALGVVPGMLGGKPRQTLPTNANVLGQLPWAYLPRRSYQSMDLTTLQVGAYSPQQLLELLADAWPELSQALSNIQRLAASKWKYDVRMPDQSKDDPEGKAELDQILGRVNVNWGGFDALINQWVMCVALQGACAGETVPNDDINDVWDIVTVQPWTIYFQRTLEQEYVAFQWQPMTIAAGTNGYNGISGSLTGGTQPGVFDPAAKAPSPSEIMSHGAIQHGGFRRLNEVTFAYVPLDADVDDPYGRAPFASVLQLVVWDMQMIKDLRQWSHVNAFGRIDVKVLAEAATAMMPPAVKANKKDARLWLKKYLEDIQQAYNNLNPDDTYVHYDNVEVGATDASGKTFDADKLIRVIERRIFRALKQLPILMGSNEGTTETWGTLQMEVYALQIANIQRTVSALITKLLNVALRLRGRNSIVTFEFETIRATDRQREAVAEWQEAKNAAFMRDQGWITQDEASIRVTGSEAVAEAPDPDPVIAPLQPDQGAVSKPAAEPANVPDPNDPNAEQKAGADGKKGEGSAGKEKQQDGTDEKKGQPAATKGRARVADSAPAPASRDEQAEEHTSPTSAPGFEQVFDSFEDLLHELLDPVAKREGDAEGDAEGDEAEAEGQGYTSAMTAFFLPAEVAGQLAVEGGEPAATLHLTLTYLGETATITDPDKLKEVVAEFAASQQPFDGQIAGIGRFTSVPEGAKHPIYASVDSPELSAFRQALAEAIDASGVATVDTTHGFTPHITLAYVDADAETPVDSVPALTLHFDSLTCALSDEYTDYALGGGSDRVRGRRARQRAALPAATYPHAGGVGSRTQAKSDNEKTRHTHRPPSAKRKRAVRRIAAEVADYFADVRLSRKRLGHIIDTHRSPAVANNKRTWPPLASAVRAILDAHAAPAPADVEREGLCELRLNDEERDALLISIAAMLQADFADMDDRLYAIILDARQSGYNVGGQEGLEAMGLGHKGTFDLTNADIIGRLQITARGQVGRIQQTTRTRVAMRIADGLLAGDSESQIGDAINGVMDEWGDFRAASIAEYEASSGYFSGSMTLWQRSGIPNKVWVTGPDPDPYAGATGEQPCRDNAYGSPVGIFESFPSGDYEPPAHNGCICDVQPEGDPSDSAAESPWLGD
jgi:2'-5' RNA ligase